MLTFAVIALRSMLKAVGSDFMLHPHFLDVGIIKDHVGHCLLKAVEGEVAEEHIKELTILVRHGAGKMRKDVEFVTPITLHRRAVGVDASIEGVPIRANWGILRTDVDLGIVWPRCLRLLTLMFGLATFLPCLGARALLTVRLYCPLCSRRVGW